MKHITVVTPCFNEEENIEAVYTETKRIFATIPEVTYDHLFIDNASYDKTVSILRGIAATDPNVSVIVNARNFGHIKSPVHGLLQAKGDAVILLGGRSSGSAGVDARLCPQLAGRCTYCCGRET